MEDGSLRWLPTEVRQRPFDPSDFPWAVSQCPFDPYRADAKVYWAYRAGGWSALQTTLPLGGLGAKTPPQQCGPFGAKIKISTLHSKIFQYKPSLGKTLWP
jgi:hypothetical protein